MKNLFLDTGILDKRANTEFKLSSEILMENAARGMLEFLLPRVNPNSKILLVCGSGDNGADCLALARMLYKITNISIYLPFGTKSALSKLQLERLNAVGENLCFLQQLEGEFDIIIDGLFGSGLKGALNAESLNLLKQLNQKKGIKIACDIPSGILKDGKIPNIAFQADFTLTMGALKSALYLDSTKDFVGEVHLLSLGVAESVFAPESPIKLLECSDFKPPFREKQNTNKGNFGHLCVCAGEKQGAGILCALSGLRSGCGLVSVLNANHLPFSLMQATEIPKNTTAIALGMGLGATKIPLLKDYDIPLLLDADIFYHKEFLELLTQHNTILTPHPKEFTQILKTLNLAEISTQDLQLDRIAYALQFSTHYPKSVLVLKGANTIIAYQENVYINPFGNNVLAKGGSGDVLAGMISGLLAQGLGLLDSALQGVLLHSFCAESYLKTSNNFSLSPLDLIEQIRYIKQF
ncbi:bifunctional ADP-dependent NAD(P)H-hydrate dehydratase/NAD(P)H-hydrate epimerase [Helicobacter sp. MIT 11-5569]|uniref:bifunctional ADP-dependent NAD(P)H-hydrate dehydratase/NAD(P)H-hydrate epimerase n=1 Tax=Helicobacter sp. MIT 11-5569 TaxID=1548151 RepID=UPI00051FC999|nr:bifunctional ADP-dependent NAD(P)H-hydrate dehydratase/NAD(P)H-hydrate epimerase [Helicobacter sp. MIT 11-5569]TLD83235.1 bifunctional ADP-dependent NAD(P)H-hydrate dehydratase/NAD(P)H-hydrate epimerase [Helicobacter sp. MIT 11-5569]